MSLIPAEFRPLKTIDDWKQKLNDLLKLATKLAQQDTTGDDAVHQAVLDLNERLTSFQLWSDPAIPGTEELDTLAESTRQDMLETSVNRRIQAIAVRSAALDAFGKEIVRRTAQDKAVAAQLRGDALQSALTAISGAITAGIGLERILDESTDEDFAKRLKKALDALQEIRDQITTMARS